MKKEMQTKFTCKNQYGYTIKDLSIDYENKTFKVGNLFFGGAQKISKWNMELMIKQLLNDGYKQI